MTHDSCLIALGGNLGDPRSNIKKALELLNKIASIDRMSSLYRTRAVGGPSGQPDFLNGVAAIVATGPPHETIEMLLVIEREMGRVRRERWGPRIIDMDLLDQGGRVIDERGLELPHPRLHERAFVLEPLMEIAPEWRHPVKGLTASEMLGMLSEPDRAVVLGREGPP